MTKPTQAQIALQKIRDWTLQQNDTVWFDQITTLHDFCDNALTAAAEVGPQQPMSWTLNKGTSLSNAFLDPATIERCARVADSFRYGGYEQIADAIAAAIRAEKDKP